MYRKLVDLGDTEEYVCSAGYEFHQILPFIGTTLRIMGLYLGLVT